MSTVHDSKAALRARMLKARAQDHGQGLDGAANAALLDWIGAARGQVIAGYMPIRSEISALPAMAALAKTHTICVPIVVAPSTPLDFHAWTPEAPMVPGVFGAAVPAEARVVVPNVVIVPLVAFDAHRARLGYGGGFYDRTIEGLKAAHPGLRVVGFAYDVQQVEAVPVETTDQALDAIITPTRVL